MNRKNRLRHNRKRIAAGGAILCCTVFIVVAECTGESTSKVPKQQVEVSLPFVVKAKQETRLTGNVDTITFLGKKNHKELMNRKKSVNILEESEQHLQNNAKSFSEEERYLLAKIAMAEAEGEDTEGKALVIRVVLNRLSSNHFPDSIEEVIFQTGQFSPIANGRWDNVEPDSDCYKALELIENGWDGSQGALYFESKSASKWHRENLKFLFQYGSHYFYTEKEQEK